MNALDWILLGLIFAAVVSALVYMRRRRKNGGFCCGGCSGCGGCTNCSTNCREGGCADRKADL